MKTAHETNAGERLNRLLLRLADLRLSSRASFLLVTLLAAAAIGLRWSLRDMIGFYAPWVFFFPIVAVGGWLGLGTALYAIILFAVAGNLFFFAPPLTGTFFPPRVANTGVFALFALLLAGITHGFRWALRRLLNAERRAKKAAEWHSALLEAEVAARTAELSDAVEQLEAFTASVAHGFRGPLRTIHGYAELAGAEPGLPEGVGPMLARIKGSSLRLDHLVTDLLGYARLNRGELPATGIDLDQAVGEVADEERFRAVVRVEKPLGQVSANRIGLHQAVLNLVENAVKFVPSERTPLVTVRTERRGRLLRLWVEDNGIGIDPEYQQRIFGVFERLHAADRYPGTGIGLAIVRKAAERMGGAAGVESVPGEGSRFWIELPEAI